MDETGWLVVILGVGAGSYMLRAAPFVIGSRIKFPPLFLEWLVLLALGLVAGIISKALFIKEGCLHLQDMPIQLAAIGVATLLNRQYRNILVALLGGIAVALLLKLLL